ncbi:Uip5 protein [Hanseniaspora uvarum]|nr:Uip5 protein [Hanseniaspora uvarum]
MLSRKSSASVSLDGGLPISNNESRKSSVILNNPKIRKGSTSQYPSSGSRLVSENNGYDTNRSFSLNNDEPNNNNKKSFSNFNVFQRNASSRNDNYIEKEIDKFNMRYGSSSNSRKPSVMKKLRNFSSEVVDEINEKKIINRRLTVGNLFWGLVIFAVLFWLLIIRPISYLFAGGSIANLQNIKYMNEFTADDLFMTSQQSQVSKFENEKFSLRLPYLDTLHNNFYITGSPIIKNTKYVRLLEKGNIGKHSVLLSKNTLPSDFEIQMSISLEPGTFKLKKQVANKRPGDGFSIFFTQENDDFVTKYPTSHEQRNRILEQTGVDTRNVDLMGIPKNLKSDNIVLDFFENGEVVNTKDNRWNGLKTPHLSCLSVSADGNEYNYLDDGLSIAHDMVSLDDSIFTTRGNIEYQPTKFKLRIIRISSLIFKIDIDYSGTGKDWQQLMNFENLNSRSKLFESFVRGGSNLRFGISALNGEQTANFQINDLRVYNYLWENPMDLVGNDGLKLEYLLDLYRREITTSGKDGWFDLNSLYRKQGLLPKDFNQKKMKQDLRQKAISNSKSDKKTVLSNGRVTQNKIDLNANNNIDNKNKSGKIFSFKALVVKTIKVLFWFTVLAVIVYFVTLFQRVQKKKMRKSRVSSKSAELL